MNTGTLRTGKLPPGLLRELLAKIPSNDPRVLLGGRVGEDAAAIDMGDRVLVAKTDPITFTSELIGWYAVQVNANDIACMGARPRWFLATVLLPEGAEPCLAKSIFSQILETCTALDVSLIGGHTEVTHKLQRPLVVGFMLGETSRERLVRTSDARPGDAIVLTKAIAIEGTAILSNMAVSHLRPKISKSILKKAEQFLFEPGISVVTEALAAQDLADIHAMHDPTEGCKERSR